MEAAGVIRFRFLTLLLALWFIIAGAADAAPAGQLRAATEPHTGSSQSSTTDGHAVVHGLSAIRNPQSAIRSTVDPQVWADLAAVRDGQTSFVVALRETPGRGPGSVITAQMGLAQVLAVLQRMSGIQSYSPAYGINAIVVRGGRGAVRYLEDWPDVAAITPYRYSAAWDRTKTQSAPAAPLAFAGAGQISGAVAGPDGMTPLPGITVYAWRYFSPIWQRVANATTAGDGSYTLSDLEPSSYRVEFNDPSGNYVTEFYNDKRDLNIADFISVFSDSTVPNINASLAAAGRIAGTITSAASGKPRNLILATAYEQRGDQWVISRSATSNSTGAYTISGLAPGIHRVYFSNPDPFAPDAKEWYINVPTLSLAADVTVAPGATTPNIDAAIGMRGDIDGLVTAFDGASVGDIAVTAYQYNPVLATYQTISQTVTSADGLYLFTLLGGTYRIGFSDPLGQLLPEFYNDRATLETADDVPAYANGEPTSGIDAVLDAPATTGNVPLPAGWNLISSYLHPTDALLPAVFASIAGQYNLVYAHDACQAATPWSKYDPAAPPYAINLAAVSVKQGLWLRTTAPATLAVTGRAPVSTQITLCTGWNLAGYPSATERPVAEALAGIAGKYSLVQAYDASDSTDPWKEYDPDNPAAADLLTLQPWRGYWIRMKQDATLTVANR
jgi:hypothetical protein